METKTYGAVKNPSAPCGWLLAQAVKSHTKEIAKSKGFAYGFWVARTLTQAQAAGVLAIFGGQKREGMAPLNQEQAIALLVKSHDENDRKVEYEKSQARKAAKAQTINATGGNVALLAKVLELVKSGGLTPDVAAKLLA